MTKTLTEEDLTLCASRPGRVRYLRDKLLRLTREELSKLSGISINTLQNWERTLNKGISEKGAQRLIEVYRSQGIECTLEWLLHGVGAPPYSPLQKTTIQHRQASEELSIQQELALFQKLNANALSLNITDDAMLPSYWPGDRVAGCAYEGKELEKVSGLISIVELENGKKLLRLVEQSDRSPHFNLYCTNKASLQTQVLNEVKLIRAAPVLWLRRRALV